MELCGSVRGCVCETHTSVRHGGRFGVCKRVCARPPALGLSGHEGQLRPQRHGAKGGGGAVRGRRGEGGGRKEGTRGSAYVW